MPIYSVDQLFSDIENGVKPRHLNFKWGRFSNGGQQISHGYVELVLNGVVERRYRFHNREDRQAKMRQLQIEAAHWCRRQRISHKEFTAFIDIKFDKQ